MKKISATHIIDPQTNLFSSRLIQSGLAGQLFKYNSLATTGFVIVNNTSLTPNAFAELGKLLNIPPILTQVSRYQFVSTYFDLSFRFKKKLLLKPVIKLLRWTTNLLENILIKEKFNVSL